jgi:cytochrome c biogenesis protein
VTGQPADFVTRAQLSEPDGGPAKTVDIRVNHPAEMDGVKFYQFGYGWAPVIRVEKDGVPIFDGPVVCQQNTPPKGVSPLQLPWNCAVKLASLDPDVGIRFELWPDSRALYALLETGKAMPMITEFAPVMTYDAYQGDLRADLVQSASALDTTAMRRFSTGVVGAGETKDLGRGLTVSFPDLRQYTVLTVSRDRGLWIVLSAAILILLGLLPAMYTSRRKLWVTAEPDGTGSRLKVGGFALQRRGQFEEEFDKVVSEMRRVSEETVGA